MTRHHVILDASAVLALLQKEPGSEHVELLLDGASIHSVNAYEVLRKLIRCGMPPEEVTALFRSLELNVISELSLEQVTAGAELLPDSEKLGLSLGDCVCLTMGHWLQSTIVTADNRWHRVAGRLEKIEFIR